MYEDSLIEYCKHVTFGAKWNSFKLFDSSDFGSAQEWGCNPNSPSLIVKFVDPSVSGKILLNFTQTIGLADSFVEIS